MWWYISVIPGAPKAEPGLQVHGQPREFSGSSCQNRKDVQFSWVKFPVPQK